MRCCKSSSLVIFWKVNYACSFLSCYSFRIYTIRWLYTASFPPEDSGSTCMNSLVWKEVFDQVSKLKECNIKFVSQRRVEKNPMSTFFRKYFVNGYTEKDVADSLNDLNCINIFKFCSDSRPNCYAWAVIPEQCLKNGKLSKFLGLLDLK